MDNEKRQVPEGGEELTSPIPVTGGRGQTKRTTLVLPESLDENLEVYALQAGLPKGEVIKKVLTQFLSEKGLQPDKRPRLQVSY